MTDKLKDIREGDTVEVTFRGQAKNVGSCGGLSVEAKDLFYSERIARVGVSASHLNDPHFSIKKVEKPLCLRIIS